MSDTPAYRAGQPTAEPFLAAAARFRRGEDSPSDYLERCLARLENCEPVLRAFVALDIEGARAAARESTRRHRNGAPLSPLDGLPVGVKDVIETRGLPTQMNTRRFAGWHSGRDAACIAALRTGGAIVLGKTVTTEFALGDSGPTTNPWHPGRTPGGSSSGSAAAVAAGLVGVALGTQEIGSLIRPASFCGVLGLKPTFGSLHQGGVHGVAPSQSHLGLLAGSLRDLAALGKQIAATAGGDPGHAPLDVSIDALRAERPRRIALVRTAAWPRISPGALATFEEFAADLCRRRLVVQSADDSPEVAAFEQASADAHDVWTTICCRELRWPLGQYLAEAPDLLGPTTARFVAMGEAISEADYQKALARREAMRTAFADMERGFDALLMPSAAGVATEGLVSTGSREFNAFSSGFGAPALSLPLLACDGLPLGVQLIGARGRDARLLRHAAWLLQEFAPDLL